MKQHPPEDYIRAINLLKSDMFEYPTCVEDEKFNQEIVDMNPVEFVEKFQKTLNEQKKKYYEVLEAL